MDITLSLLKEAKDNFPRSKKVSLVLGAVRFLPFRDRAFNFILCSSAIEHLQEDDTKKAICELERSAKGRIQIDVPNTGFLPELLRHILFKESCKDISSSKASPLYHHSVWTIKKIKGRRFRGEGVFRLVNQRTRQNSICRQLIRYICLVHSMDSWNHNSHQICENSHTMLTGVLANVQ